MFKRTYFFSCVIHRDNGLPKEIVETAMSYTSLFPAPLIVLNEIRDRIIKEANKTHSFKSIEVTNFNRI